MLTGPIPATRTLLERNGMTIGDIDLIEISEAFASVERSDGDLAVVTMCTAGGTGTGMLIRASEKGAAQ